MAKSNRRWPPNVGVNNGRVRFRRKMPPDVESSYGKRLYVEYLDLDETATYDQAFEAAKPAKTRYDALIKSLRNSSPDAFTENELEALASDYLKRAKVEQGGLALHNIGPVFIKQYGLEGVEESLGRKLTSDDLKLIFFPELAKPLDRTKDIKQALGITKGGLFDGLVKAKPTIQELAMFRAAEAATTVRSRQPKTLSWWWDDYLEFKGLTDPSDRATMRVQQRWDRFLTFVGDHVITTDTQQVLEDALEDQVAYRLKQVSPDTARRELNEVVAALTRMARRQRPSWSAFRVPETPEYEPEEREPLHVDEQITLVEYCLTRPDDWVSTVFLLELQGGMMASEIASIKPNDINLEGDYPHLVLRKGKTKSRPRVIPVVLGLNVIKGNIETAIERLGKVKVPSATPTKRIKKLFDSKYTCHCLRHTMSINGSAHGVSNLHMQTIGGWSDGKVNKTMLNYGKAGLANQANSLRAIYQASLQLNQHLMHLETAHADMAKVVQIKQA